MPPSLLNSQLATLEPPTADEPAIKSLVIVTADVIAASDAAGVAAHVAERLTRLLAERERHAANDMSWCRAHRLAIAVGVLAAVTIALART